MNASQLHSWVLKNLTPLQHESSQRQGDLIASGDHNDFWMESGRHAGLHEASALLLDLIEEMFDAERAEMEARWAAEDAAEAVTRSAENVTHA